MLWPPPAVDCRLWLRCWPVWRGNGPSIPTCRTDFSCCRWWPSWCGEGAGNWPPSNGESNWWGLAIVACGAVQMLLGTLAAQVFIARTAFLVSLAGAVLFLGGTRALRILAFPLLLLLFLFPIPAIVYARITLPMQIFASATAETVLNSIGIPVLRDGNILELPHERLSVVEACSGIRSLLSRGFLSLVYAYFFYKRVGMRWILLAATVPIAIGANAVRITLMGLFGLRARLICSRAGCCLWWRSACWSQFIIF